MSKFTVDRFHDLRPGRYCRRWCLVSDLLRHRDVSLWCCIACLLIRALEHPDCDNPKTGTLQMIALPPQSTRCRFGNAPPSASCMLQHARDAGGIKVATDTQVHDGTYKRMYNITTKTPRVKNPNIHTKIQIIHKAK
jgi:hypothetical protein